MKNKTEITILPELYVFIQSPTYDELMALEENIIRDGCREPLTVWETEGKTILVDGHNRYKICKENSIEFQTYPTHFENIEDVKKWMINNQLGRRNLTKEQQSYLRGKAYQSQKNKMGSNQWDGSENTVKKLAKEHKVSEKTIQRDEKYMLAVDKLVEAMKDLSSEGTAKIFKERILSKQINISKKDILLVDKLDENELKSIVLDINRNTEDTAIIFSNERDRQEKLEALEECTKSVVSQGFEWAKISKISHHLSHEKLYIQLSFIYPEGFKIFYINKSNKEEFEETFYSSQECKRCLEEIISRIVFGETIESDEEIIDSILEKFPPENIGKFEIEKTAKNRFVLTEKDNAGGPLLLCVTARDGDLFYSSQYGQQSNVVEFDDIINCVTSIIEEKDKEEEAGIHTSIPIDLVASMKEVFSLKILDYFTIDFTGRNSTIDCRLVFKDEKYTLSGNTLGYTIFLENLQENVMRKNVNMLINYCKGGAFYYQYLGLKNKEDKKDKEEAIEVECDLEKSEIEVTTESTPHIPEIEQDKTDYFDRELMQEWHGLHSEMPFPGQKTIVGVPYKQHRYFRGSSDFLWAECAKLIQENNLQKSDRIKLEKENKKLISKLEKSTDELYELKLFKYHTVNNFISFPNFKLDDANLLRDIEKSLQEKGYNPTFVNVENLGYLNIYLDSQKWDIGSHEGVEELIGIVKECSESYQKKLIKSL